MDKEIKKPRKIRKPKPVKSEVELVRAYANTIISLGNVNRADTDKIIKEGPTSNKDLWTDTDFYFSVVFQSSKQRDQFMDQFVDKLSIPVNKENTILIINGVELAKRMGFKINLEKCNDFPIGDLALKSFILE